MRWLADRKQTYAGLIFVAIGMFTLWRLPSPIGTMHAMGPGYFPMILGIGLILFGGASVMQGLRNGEAISVDRLPLQAMAFVVSGVFAFALLLPTYGLVPALAVLVLACCYRRVLVSPLEVLLVYLFLLALTWFVFIYLIQLPISIY